MLGGVALERDQRADRARRTRAPIASVADRCRRAPGRAACSRAPMTIAPASGKARTSQAAGRSALIRAAPAARRRRSAGGGGTSRRSGRGRPSPRRRRRPSRSIAKIWPSPLPVMREKAISARLAALSISSRQSRITSGLRRVSTPPAPMQKISAETTRYQPMLTQRSAGSPVSAAPAAPGVGRSSAPTASAIVPVHGERGVMQCAASALGVVERRPARRGGARARPRRRPRSAAGTRRPRTGSRNFVSSSSPIAPGEPKPGTYGAPSVSIAFRPEPSIAIAQLDEQRDRERRRRDAAAARRRGVQRLVAAADVGDDEHVEHHHRAGVDDDLRGGDELARAAAGTAPPARAGGRPARARCRTGCAARRRRSRRRSRRSRR